MWISISRKDLAQILKDNTECLKILGQADKEKTKQIEELNLKYRRLLNHLGLVEWIEPPKDAIPAKTVLITKKEQKKRNKKNQQSWVDPKIRQQRQQADMFRNVYGCGQSIIPPAWQNQTFSGILGSLTSSK